MAERYPGYDVLAKWNSPSFDDPTRSVLSDRLGRVPERSFLSEEAWGLLDAVVGRLIPQPDRADPIAITPWIDAMLAAGRGDGYRHEGVPTLREAWLRGLAGIATEAKALNSREFATLDPAEQDALLSRVQRGEATGEHWRGLPADHFFGHILLRTVVGIYYSHPEAWSEIGFGGPASPRGYVRMGFDGRDPWDAGDARDG